MEQCGMGWGSSPTHTVELDLVPLLIIRRKCGAVWDGAQVPNKVPYPSPHTRDPHTNCPTPAPHTWVAHLIHAGMRSTHAPSGVSSRHLILVLGGGGRVQYEVKARPLSSLPTASIPAVARPPAP